MSLNKILFRSFLALVCLGVFVGTASAQFRARVEGTVSDTSGGVLNGAQVTVTSQETGKAEVVTTSESGFYSVTSLAPGLYTISASLTGFKTEVLKDVPIAAEK